MRNSDIFQKPRFNGADWWSPCSEAADGHKDEYGASILEACRSCLQTMPWCFSWWQRRRETACPICRDRQRHRHCGCRSHLRLPWDQKGKKREKLVRRYSWAANCESRADVVRYFTGGMWWCEAVMSGRGGVRLCPHQDLGARRSLITPSGLQIFWLMNRFYYS
jgi:hypothetical protein